MDDAKTPEHKLVAPEADLNQLSFCASNSTALADWVAELPMANTGETATRLLKAAPELARVRSTYLVRFELLETLRPTIHYICARLDRGALNKSHGWNDVVQTAQRLQRALCDGYQAVVIGTMSAIDEDKAAKDIMVQATHRALADLSRVLLRNLRAYVQIPEGLWLAIHQLYSVAEQLNLTEQRCMDNENHTAQTTSISDVYLRSLLLYAAQPNQLRPQDLNHLFNALEQWTGRASITADEPSALLSVDLHADSGPRYSKVSEPSANKRDVHTSVLAYEIEAYLRDIPSSVPIPEFVSNRLLEHVSSAWGTVHTRSFRRMPIRTDVHLCIGLRTSHYYVAEGRLLEEQVDDESTHVRARVNPFLQPIAQSEPSAQLNKQEKDIWTDALKAPIPENPYINPDSVFLSQSRNLKKPSRAQFVDHRTQAVDTSPTGYCLQWRDDPPHQLQVGEIIALRERAEDPWAVGTLRWVRKSRRSGFHTGVELLSPRAVPVAARVVRTKAGATEFTRALLLPPLPQIDQPATLLTPRLPFHAQQKVQIHYQGTQATAHLETCVRSTDNFNQFTFRVLGSYLENPTSASNMTALDYMLGEGLPTGKA